MPDYWSDRSNFGSVPTMPVTMHTAIDRSLVLGVAVLLGVYLHHAWCSVRGPTPLEPSSVWNERSDRVAIERVGRGLACVAPRTHEALARICGSVRCGHVSAPRRLLIGATLSLADATVADLEALPDIGPALAARLHALRPLLLSRRSEAVRILAGIRGIGARRATRIVGPLGLAGMPRDDICSWGSWPTTSSGSDRPR